MFRTAFLIALFLLPNLAFAQTFNVSTTAQLRSAFENASVNGEYDTITLEAGTYKTTDDSIGTFKFSDTEAHNLTIKAKDGLTATDVILDGANTHQVLNLKSTKTATFTLDRLTIKNGKNSDFGGGVYCEKRNNLIVTNSSISGNTTSSFGGGIKGDTVTVNNSVISGNASHSGGAIDGFTVTVTNSTISGNTSLGSGGGISGAVIIVIDSIIFGNTAPSTNIYSAGGGIDGHTITAVNSIISGNMASRGGGCFTSHGIFINNIFNNNDSDIYFTGYHGLGNHYYIGNSNVYNNYIDYTKLQNESSYTVVKKNNIQPSSGGLNFADSNFRLSAGSVAIDKGLNPNSNTFKNLFKDAKTLKTITNALKTDKDGNPRIVGSIIDLGAYEYR